MREKVVERKRERRGRGRIRKKKKEKKMESGRTFTQTNYVTSNPWLNRFEGEGGEKKMREVSE